MTREPEQPDSKDPRPPERSRKNAGDPQRTAQDLDATVDASSDAIPQPERPSAESSLPVDPPVPESGSPVDTAPPADAAPDGSLEQHSGDSSKADSFQSNFHLSVDNPRDETVDSVQQSSPPGPEGTCIQSSQAAPTKRTNPAGQKTGRSQLTAQPADRTLVSGQNRQQSIDERARRGDVPDSIGRYQVRRLLGEGAFGRVYEAHDPQLDRRVAVKVAKSVSGKTQIKRFLREARAAAQLRHPNIIPVYEYGQVDGENIIVYQFVAGQTLKSLIQRKPGIELQQAVHLVRKIAEGLDYAHEQGIIHRDMKPDNVLIDQHGNPHIADFGCARSIDDDMNLTVDGSILGTPMYMSPEQAGGRSNLADGRTDIWSLGVMLFEMVSGEKPFVGGLSDLLFLICNEDAPPLRKLKPEVPVEIDTICAKCLTRDLDQRFSSAQFLADELGRFERGEPILSRRTSTLKRTWMWAKRNPAVAGLLATVAFTLVLGTIISSSFAYQAYAERQARAVAHLNALTTSQPEQLPDIFEALVPFRSNVLPELRQRLAAAELSDRERHRIRMAMLELESDPNRRRQIAQELIEYLLTADAGDFRICRRCLRFHQDELLERLWNIALERGEMQPAARKFRAAAALAMYQPDAGPWSEVAPDVAHYLISMNQIEMAQWLDALDQLETIREKLKPTLVTAFGANQHDQRLAAQTSATLSLMFPDQVPFIAELISTALPQQLPFLTDALQTRRTKAVEELQRKLDAQPDSPDKNVAEQTRNTVNWITALVHLNSHPPFVGQSNDADPSIATALIENLGPTLTPAPTLLEPLQAWDRLAPDELSEILLSLGQYSPAQLGPKLRERWRSPLLTIFSTHPDSRVHAAARWLLTRWDFGDQMLRKEHQLRSASPASDMGWHVDLDGNTFAIFGPMDAVNLGLNPDFVSGELFNVADVVDEPFHRKTIPRRVGVALFEVTIQQFEVYERAMVKEWTDQHQQLQQQLTSLAEPDDDASSEDQLQFAQRKKQVQREMKKLDLQIQNVERVQNRRSVQRRDVPITDVTFASAVSYCSWYSQQQGLTNAFPDHQQLRDVFDKGSDFAITATNLQRHGYRLPTAAEWEFACRGETQTIYPFGRLPSAIESYAWISTNSNSQLQPVGLLKPGPLGLFDSLGNASEWTLDWYHERLPQEESERSIDYPLNGTVRQSPTREFRGGSYREDALSVRSSKRSDARPISGFPRLGFRLARTFERKQSK